MPAMLVRISGGIFLLSLTLRHGTAQGLDLGRGVAFGLHGHDFTDEVVVGFGDAGGVGTLHTLDQHLHGAVGQLEHLQDAGNTTHVEHVVGPGFVLAGCLLRHQHDLAALLHGSFQRLDRLRPPHEQRDDHVRKHHHIAQRQQRKRDGIGWEDGMSGH